MLKALAAQLTSEEILDHEAFVVVGVSGGPDSMALLHLLLALNKDLDWNLRLHVAHLDHELRGQESKGDAGFVQAAADGLSIPCTIEKRNVKELADQESVGIEEIGRRERYAFFERVCLQTESKVVTLGHHANDNAETILHRILRGTGLRGLAGIPRTRSLSYDSDIRVVRPLLRFTSAAIRAYLDDTGIAYREDKTNESTEPMRNRIRHVILPQLRAEVNPQVDDAIIRLGEQAQWLEEYLRETVQRTFETLIISRTDQSLTLNAQALARKSRIVQTEIVRLAYRSFGLGEQDLSFGHLTAVLELIGDPTSGKQAQLPGGMTIEKRYQHLVFSLPTEEARETISAEIAIHLPGRTLLPIRRLEIECSERSVTPDEVQKLKHAASRYEEFVDREAVHPPLVVRKRRQGDRFVPLGAPGTKKLSDFLTSTKVDPKERELVAVLCDQLGPIWIIGHRIDDRVKMTSLTRRVLHLCVQTLER